MSLPGTVVVLAKEPVPGRVKTRLCPPYTPAQAAALASAALADTLSVVAAAPVRRRILCLDGAPGWWLPRGFEVVAQIGGGLDERIAAALVIVDGSVLVLGMDTPQLWAADLDLPGLAGDAATTRDGTGTARVGGEPHAWLGPAEDGGFWALGLTRADPALVLGVPMSRADTGACQRRRLEAAGLEVTDLRTLRDVDTAADVPVVAALAPGSSFARVAGRIAGPGRPLAAA